MLILGHPWIKGDVFVKVFSIDEIKKSNTGEVVLLEPLTVSIELARYCKENSIRYGVTVGSLKEALFANALGALYVVCQREHVIEIQKIAQEYLFDTKIIVLIEEEREIETMARFGVDGVVFPNAIRSYNIK